MGDNLLKTIKEAHDAYHTARKNPAASKGEIDAKRNAFVKLARSMTSQLR